MSSANDYSRLGVVSADDTHDYTAIMKYCQDENNWFKRLKGEWDEPDCHCGRPWCGREPSANIQ